MLGNKTARLAVLGSVQRAAAGKYSPRTNTALKRRVVVAVLVVLSLVMITLYFREPQTGGLHALQGAGATALRPFEVAAERVARPFRDVYGYFSGLVNAKAENERLRLENTRLRQEVILNQAARREAQSLREDLNFHAPPGYPEHFTAVFAAVIAYPPSAFEQELVIDAGLEDGIRPNDPVMDGVGLVGRVIHATEDVARVTLLTDESSAVSAVDIATGATGLVKNGRAGSGSLILDDVEKRFDVRIGDEIVTAGTQRGERPSYYPRGIPIGKVTSAGQTDTDHFKRIQVEPFVDFGAVDSVIVLVPRRGADRR